MSTKYTEDHEWVRTEGDVVVIGITDYAQEQLGDIVFIELPEVGANFAAKDEVGVIESVKAASEFYAPVSGEIVEVNGDLEGEPAKVNAEPLGGGWLMKVKLSDPGELDGLMDEAAYKDHIRE